MYYADTEAKPTALKPEKGKTVWEQEDLFDRLMEKLGERSYRICDLNLDDLLEIITWQIYPLKKQAREILDNYFDAHITGNKLHKRYQDKSVLGCRMRIKGSSIYLEWFFNTWVKLADGRNKPFSTYIKRGKGMSYSQNTLLRYAKDWEVDLVLETEQAFAQIRRQNHFLAKARQNIREMKKSQNKINEQNHFTS